ncbi:PREDICTED: palmitoyltransferase ZDHHC3-like [Drosophila arizonae]|uniref:Palmitoyltransferase n=1 Tax=Drosophila arizonae TaxID=7263 RepID=A0ABM1NU85_DROAR|nr:PREDICTED: palmitoyltransferase ZDHHC3-like [Drosophila arizonae]
MVFILDPSGIICLIATYGALIYADYVVIQWIIITAMPLSIWAPFHVVLFHAIVLLVFLSHSKAVFTDPGIVPLPSNRPFSEIPSGEVHGSEWTVCSRCKTHRPPRAHHCSTCQRCIRRMDHHCPWINNCVGEGNQKYFLQFLFYVAVLSFYSVALVLGSWVSPCTECNQIVKQTQWMHTLILMLESAFFGLFVSFILMDQLHAILYDETAVEAIQHRGSYRPNLPKYQLLSEVFGPGHPISWLLPCAKLKHSERHKPCVEDV